VDWCNERFAWYYAHADVPMPSRFGRREFGFMYLAKNFMVRHVAFGSGEELRAYLEEHAPAHAYYSTAYYENPRGERMADKGWLGADLIFDLDADHVAGAKDKSFEEMLRIIQKEMVKLVHDFLLDDFGFAPEHLRIVFSGGRGYHVHVSDPAVLGLGSAERREIVDYLEGVGLDFERVLGERVVHVAQRGMRRVKEKRTEARADAPGWGGRIVRGELEVLEELRQQEPKAARQALREMGVKDDKARELMEALHATATDSAGTTFLDRIRETGYVPTGHAVDKVLRMAALQQKALAAKTGETDEPVTSDIKRLIRLPFSVHGKTGLRVVPIPLARIEAFDPLREALAYGTSPVEVTVSKPERVRLGEKEYDVQPGPQVLPERVALFLCLRRKALVA
jgi:DNA primase small subunit